MFRDAYNSHENGTSDENESMQPPQLQLQVGSRFRRIVRSEDGSTEQFDFLADRPALNAIIGAILQLVEVEEGHPSLSFSI